MLMLVSYTIFYEIFIALSLCKYTKFHLQESYIYIHKLTTKQINIESDIQNKILMYDCIFNKIVFSILDNDYIL